MRPRDYGFHWNAWNVAQVEKHGLTVADVQFVVWNARHPFPRHYKRGGWEVRGRTPQQRLIQVFFFVDNYGDIYVYHAE